MNMICKCVNEDSYEKAVEKMYIETMDENTYIVKIKGNKTIVINNKGEEGVAKCHPDDEFDISEGVKIAFKDLTAIRLSDDELDYLNTALVLGCNSVMRHDLYEYVRFVSDNGNVLLDRSNPDNKMFTMLEPHKHYKITDVLARY